MTSESERGCQRIGQRNVPALKSSSGHAIARCSRCMLHLQAARCTDKTKEQPAKHVGAVHCPRNTNSYITKGASEGGASPAVSPSAAARCSRPCAPAYLSPSSSSPISSSISQKSSSSILSGPWLQALKASVRLPDSQAGMAASVSFLHATV